MIAETVIATNMGIRRFLSHRGAREDARDELRRIAADQKSQRSGCTASVCDSEDELNTEEIKIAGNHLLLVCHEDPTLHNVIQVLKDYPDAAKTVNSRQQTPLHVAAANGASTDVLHYLLDQYPEACALSDEEGKYPLHYLSHASFWTPAGRGVFWDGASLVGPTYHEMVKMLCKAFPAATLREDEEGCNPIEYAVTHNATLEVIRSLQRTSVRFQQAHAKHKYETTPVASCPVTSKYMKSYAGRTA